MKNNFILHWLAIIIVMGCATWSKSRFRLKNTIPHARTLIKLKQLRDAGADSEANALLDRRLKHMSEMLHAEGFPLPPKEGVRVAQAIDACLNLSRTNTP